MADRAPSTHLVGREAELAELGAVMQPSGGRRVGSDDHHGRGRRRQDGPVPRGVRVTGGATAPRRHLPAAAGAVDWPDTAPHGPARLVGTRRSDGGLPGPDRRRRPRSGGRRLGGGGVVDRPLVVVVDDLQWADDSLRDLVLYLLAGPSDRRLAVLVTARTAGLPDGDPFHRWLADALHLPGVSPTGGRPAGTARAPKHCWSDLVGGRPHQSLVEEVYRAGRGNPYLTSLLARNLAASDRHLPDALPGDLVTAVKGAWHGCSQPTRTLCSLLAVGGGPVRRETLDTITGALALDLDLGRSLPEAEAAGLVEPTADGRYWFRHPLQAEVLERAVAATERRGWLAAYASHGDTIAAVGSGPDARDRGGPVRAARPGRLARGSVPLGPARRGARSRPARDGGPAAGAAPRGGAAALGDGRDRDLRGSLAARPAAGGQGRRVRRGARGRRGAAGDRRRGTSSARRQPAPRSADAAATDVGHRVPLRRRGEPCATPRGGRPVLVAVRARAGRGRPRRLLAGSTRGVGRRRDRAGRGAQGR